MYMYHHDVAHSSAVYTRALCQPRMRTIIIMHKTGPFTISGVSKFVKLVVVYTKHQQLNNKLAS